MKQVVGNKIKYLDGLRAVSALMVVFHHYILALLPAMYNADQATFHLGPIEGFLAGSPLGIFYAGNFAVCIFYILSGFVLSFKFLQTKNYEIIISSAFRRYFRLVLPIFFAVFISYLLMKLGLYFNKQAAEISGSNWWFLNQWNFIATIPHMLKSALFGVFFTYDASYNTALWMMTYEFLGSFLVLAILAIFGKFRIRYLAYLIAIILLRNTYYFAFILGIFLADLYAQNKHYSPKIDKWYFTLPVFLFGLFLGAYPFGIYTQNTLYSFFAWNFLPSPGQFWHIIGAFLVIASVMNSKSLQKLFETKFLEFTGNISFCIYLIHALVLGSFSSWLFIQINPHLPYLASFTIVFLSALPIIYLAGYLMTKYIDHNGIIFSRWLYSKTIEKLQNKEAKIS